MEGTTQRRKELDKQRLVKMVYIANKAEIKAAQVINTTFLPPITGVRRGPLWITKYGWTALQTYNVLGFRCFILL